MHRQGEGEEAAEEGFVGFVHGEGLGECVASGRGEEMSRGKARSQDLLLRSQATISHGPLEYPSSAS